MKTLSGFVRHRFHIAEHRRPLNQWVLDLAENFPPGPFRVVALVLAGENERVAHRHEPELGAAR
jgi:hypothetical protein